MGHPITNRGSLNWNNVPPNNGGFAYISAKGIDSKNNSGSFPKDKIENTNAFLQDLQKFIKKSESAGNYLVNSAPASKPMNETSKSLSGKISFSEHLLNLKNKASVESKDKDKEQPKQVVDSYTNKIPKDAMVPDVVKSSPPTPVKSISKPVKAKVPLQSGLLSTENLSKQILLVEDDLLLRKSLAFYISDKGFTVVQAENGMEAIEHIKNKNFDLIITDLKLPYIGGMEMINIVRNELKLSTPIIVLSVSGVEEVEVNSFTMGANEFIAKPFSPSVLMARIENLLTKKAA